MLLYFKKPNEYQKTRQKRVIPKNSWQSFMSYLKEE